MRPGGLCVCTCLCMSMCAQVCVPVPVCMPLSVMPLSVTVCLRACAERDGRAGWVRTGHCVQHADNVAKRLLCRRRRMRLNQPLGQGPLAATQRQRPHQCIHLYGCTEVNVCVCVYVHAHERVLAHA
jgi:hypothetical protein